MSKNVYRKYDISIANHFGTGHFAANTAIAFDRLLYWFKRYREGFHKFKQPCKRKPGLYRKGDSWGEELGMSRKVLDRVFDRLVTHYKTKSAYLEATDKFAGKIFCSYTNHKTNLTHYSIDWEALSKFITTTSSTLPPLRPSSSLEVNAVSDVPKTIVKVPPSDVPLEHHLVCARLTAFNTQTITSFVEPPSKPPVDKLDEERIKLIVKSMVNTWNSQMNDQVVPWPSIVPKLYEILQTYFGGDLEKFKKYCETVAANKFFAGKSSSTYKLFLFQAIKPEFLQTILNSCGVKSAITIPISDEKELDRSIDNLANQLQVIEQKKSSILSEYKANQKKKTGEKIASLSPEQLAADRKIFEHEYFEKNQNKADLGDDKFSRMIIDVHFDGKDGFLYRKYGLEFSQEIVYPPHLLAEEKSIINAITLKENELKSLKGVNLSKKYVPHEAPRKAWEPEPVKRQERGLRSFGQLFSFG